MFFTTFAVFLWPTDDVDINLSTISLKSHAAADDNSNITRRPSGDSERPAPAKMGFQGSMQKERFSILGLFPCLDRNKVQTI